MDRVTQPPISSGSAGRGNPALLRLIADSVPAALAYFVFDGGLCTFANQRYAELMNKAVQDIVGRSVQETLGQHYWKSIQEFIQRSGTHELVQYTREHVLRNGRTCMLEVSLVPHMEQQGTEEKQRIGTFVLINDITHHSSAEQALRQSEERMRKLAAATEEAVVFHQGGIISDVNDATCRLTGHRLEDFLGHSIFEFVCPEFHATTREYTRLEREDPYEIAICHRDGRRIPVEVVGKTMPWQDTTYRVAVLRDITARQQAQEREAFARQHDLLTGLPNRRHLMERLGTLVTQAQQQQGAVTTLLLDLDHFKTVNDSLGQQMGDQLLCEVAQRIRQCLGSADVLARIGNDQFVVVQTSQTSADHAATTAQRLLLAMQPPFLLGAQAVPMSASIGIGLHPDDGLTSDVLLRNADAAMQHAKQTGRGRYQRFQSGMDTHALQVLERERALRQAIQAQSFVLHYQPQICLKTGTLKGLEALVRWQPPGGGTVGPDEFIGFAEERGLIADIGRWVLHEACRQLKAWQDQGLALVPVAVNLSGLEFRQRDLVQEIAEVLQSTGLAPQYLEVELTESVLMHQTGQVTATLHALKALGLGIAVDDFGTGYSSLAYLKRYPIDKLKIDRSFVIDTPSSSDDVAIVTAIVQMGRSLQKRVVAEGVETAEQMDLLRGLGCDDVQGFHVSAPMNAERTGEWLAQQPRA